MFDVEYGESAVEVLDILKNTKKADVEKIPSSFIKFLEEIASKNYKINFDHSKKINELNVKEKTKEILGIIYINWWCDKKDQEFYKDKIREQEIKRQQELRKRYDPDKIFKNKNNLQEYSKIKTEKKELNENVSMIEYKENFFYKLLRFFKKKRKF